MGSCASCDAGSRRHKSEKERASCAPVSVPCAAVDVEGLSSLCGDGHGNGNGNGEGVSDVAAVARHARMTSNGSSDVACVFTLQGRKGINQDAMIVWQDFIWEDTVFCGVFDGHGPYGHLVARTVRDSLPGKLQTFWKNASKNKIRGSGFLGRRKKSRKRMNILESATESQLFCAWKEAYSKSYKLMDKELKYHQKVDCFCSGSTAVSVVKQGDYLFIGNVGDSRAVLATKADDDSLIPVQLTTDLKPDLPCEAERIRRCKGRVFALLDEPEVHRVWLPYDDAPGLAMARALGDFCLKDYGVIATPEVSCRQLTDRDQFVILASDGVWDVLSNEEVVDIVSSSPRSMAATAVVEAAVHEWSVKYPTSKIDDCAVVCLFLEKSGIKDIVKLTGKQACCSPEQRTRGIDDEGPLLQRLDTIKTKCTQTNVDFRYEPELIEFDSHNSVAFVEQNWSGLEGVTRVNSLVHLPRFPERDHKRIKKTQQL